jgi:hypothetical protein
VRQTLLVLFLDKNLKIQEIFKTTKNPKAKKKKQKSKLNNKLKKKPRKNNKINLNGNFLV